MAMGFKNVDRLGQILRHLSPPVQASSVRCLATSSPIAPRDVCIVGVARTPMGAFNGSLASVQAPELGAVAIRAALTRAGVSPDKVDEVLMGNVLGAGIGQAPARQAALKAGLPTSVCCTTVNKVCSSGLKTITMAAQSIATGTAEVVVAGGMESMSNVPYYLSKARGGYRLGHGEVTDGIIKDGLWDAYKDFHMGNCGEICASHYGFTREDQDAEALQSLERAVEANSCGKFEEEIATVEIKGRRGKPSTFVATDDALAHGVNPDKIRALRPVFQKDGSITAGNASPISDGAAAVVLVSGAKAQELGLKVLARIRGYADAEQDPEWFSTSPSLAIPKALHHAGISKDEVDYFEINEAFAVVNLANKKLLELNDRQVNIHGGAVAMGHPIGASGARIVVTLLTVLQHEDGKIGCAAICNGGGGASALVIQV